MLRKAIIVLLMLVGRAYGVEVPTNLDLMDKCEVMWHAHKYNELYGYVDSLMAEHPTYTPYVFCEYIRSYHFGYHYDRRIEILKSFSNQVEAAMCEVNPWLVLDLRDMMEDDNKLMGIFDRCGKDQKYRSEHMDPRKNKTFGFCPKWSDSASGTDYTPFYIPNVDLVNPDRPRGPRRKVTGTLKGASDLEIARMLVDARTYREQQAVLDAYLSDLVATGGMKRVIARFGDELVRMNGYAVLDYLKDNRDEAKKALFEYFDTAKTGISPFDSLSFEMVVWALLQFAHDDAMVAMYMRDLNEKIPENFKAARRYLKKALEHLDSGCKRHFLKVSPIDDAIEVTPLRRSRIKL